MRRFYGTAELSFDFTSTVTGTRQHHATIDELLEDITIARIAGGMHLRSSVRDGQTLGRNVADLAAQTKFTPR